MTSPSSEQWRALFEPRGIVVAGASSHPGKFGFVALHNILRHDYPGEVFATNREGGEILGRRVLTSIDDLPEGAADLVFVCTPAAANLDLLKACAAKGVKAAFVTSAGYGEAGEDGRAAEQGFEVMRHGWPLSRCGIRGVTWRGGNRERLLPAS